MASCRSPNGSIAFLHKERASRYILKRQQQFIERLKQEIQDDVSIHAPFEANLEEVTPLPNESYPPEGGGFKPEFVFDEATD
jgi:hypothetical protein